MTNGIRSDASELPPIERSFRHLDYRELPFDITRAIEIRQRAVAKALVGLALQAEAYRKAPMGLVRAHLMDLSLARFDQIDELQAGREIDDELKGELDDIYPRTAAILKDTLIDRETMRRSTTADDQARYVELIGGVSELTAFALFNRMGSQSTHIATASTPVEDTGSRNKNGENESFDLRVVSTRQPGEAHVQVKTDQSYDVYARGNMIVSISELAGSTEDALHTLPYAIIHEAQGGVPKQEYRILNRASKMLFRQTQANLDLHTLTEDPAA